MFKKTPMTPTYTGSKALHITLFIFQGLLAFTFIWAGIGKLTMPETLPYPWVRDNAALVIISGIADLLGGIGILLPSLLRIKPQLSVTAAYGIILLMLVASAFHIARSEVNVIGFNIVLSVLAAFVAWGRKRKAPIAPK